MDYNKDSELFIGLLIEKRDTLNDIFIMTQEVSLSDDADSADAYISLIDKRQSLLDRIVSIEQKLSLLEMALSQQVQDDNFRKEAELISAQTQSILNRMIKLDHKLQTTASNIMGSIKKELKEINNNKTINAHYSDDSFSNNGYYFDKKK